MRNYEEDMAAAQEPTMPSVTWWKHSPPTIGGIVVSMDEQDSEYGRNRVLVIRCDDEHFARRVNGQMQNELDVNGVEVGSEIAIKWLGMVESKNARSYHRYVVRNYSEKTDEETAGAPIAKDSFGASGRDAPADKTDDDFDDDIPF